MTEPTPATPAEPVLTTAAEALGVGAAAGAGDTPAGAGDAAAGSDRPARARTEDLVAQRAELLPEEQTVGSDDPELQARVILEDSERRTEEPGAAPTTHLERRTSDQAV